MTAVIAEISSIVKETVRSIVVTEMKDVIDHHQDTTRDKCVAEAVATNAKLDSNLSRTTRKLIASVKIQKITVVGRQNAIVSLPLNTLNIQL